jgi:HEAT repeat protein
MYSSRIGIRVAPLILLAVGWSARPSVAPISDEQILEQHHIALTTPSLVEALRSDDPMIRRLAAKVLSTHYPKEAIPDIEQAMFRESNNPTRMSMAFDLARLGDQAGRQMLVDECHDTSKWGSERIAAAWDMSVIHDDSCVDSVLEILQSNSNPHDTRAKTEALELVPTFIGHLSKQDSDWVLELVANGLEDPWPGVRVTASEMLDRLEYVAAIPRLKGAIAREQDQSCRGELERHLKQLQRKRTDKTSHRTALN